MRTQAFSQGKGNGTLQIYVTSEKNYTYCYNQSYEKGEIVPAKNDSHTPDNVTRIVKNDSRERAWTPTRTESTRLNDSPGWVAADLGGRQECSVPGRAEGRS